MIVMTFTIELDIGLFYLLQSALPLASDRSRDADSSSWRSKRSYGHCRRRTEIPEAEPLPDTRGLATFDQRVRGCEVSRKTRPMKCPMRGRQTDTRRSCVPIRAGASAVKVGATGLNEMRASSVQRP